MEAEELDELIAGNVRAARARLRISQQDLADDMGWTRSMVSSLESKSRHIRTGDLVLLCQALKMPLVDLLDGAPGEVFAALGLDRRKKA